MSEPAKIETPPATDNRQRFTPDEVIASQRNRQLIIITVVCLVLAGLVALTRVTSKPEVPVVELPLVGGTTEAPAFKKADVTAIEIWGGTSPKLVLRNEREQWRVPGRFNTPADEREVNALLTKLMDAKRLNRPASTQAESFVLYRLEDEAAAHLRILGEGGKELLHLMVGKAETGNRAFVRFVGDGAPAGIFEVSDMTGDFDSLYSRLHLTPEGTPNTKRWLDLSSFQPLPFEAVAQRISLRDGDRTVQFSRVAGSDPGAEDWEMVSPRKSRANGANVRAIVDALMNFNASDIAGKLDTDGGALGVIDAKREIVVEYTEGEKQTVSRLYFGNVKDNQVATLLKATDRGELVYWCSDAALSRIFRPTGDFLEKARLVLIPDGIQPTQMLFFDKGKVVRIERDASDRWQISEPFIGKASLAAVSNVLTTLLALQGYGDDAKSIKRDELKLGPGLSEQWIEAQWKPRDNGSDGDDEPDTPEKPEDPETPTQPKPPALKTARLYFGVAVDGDVPVLRLQEGDEDRVFWIPQARLAELFTSPRDLQEPENTGAMKFTDEPVEITVRDGESTLKLEKADGWKIAGEPPVAADSVPLNQLQNGLRSLTGVRHEGVIDHEALGVGENAKRAITVALGREETSQRITLRFGTPDHGYTPVWSERTGSEEKLHWVDDANADALFINPADYRMLGSFKAKVRQILVSWEGNVGGVQPKDAGRTKEQALALVKQIVAEAATADFIELQRKHNEDSVPDNTYDVDESPKFVKPFTRLASELKVGEVGYCESKFGFHILKRVE